MLTNRLLGRIALPVVALSALWAGVACAPLAAPPATPGGAATPVAATPVSGPVTVLAAGSLIDVMNELKALHEQRNPGSVVNITVNNSAALRGQIQAGAPFDVFASADTQNMDPLVAERLVQEPAIFARNVPVIAVPRANPRNIESLEDLGRSGVRLLLVAENSPVTQAFRTTLERASATAPYGADFGRRVLANVVSYEATVRNVTAKLELGEADAGVVFRTDVSTAPDARLVARPIPDALNQETRYPIALAARPANPAAAAAFRDLVLSPDGQAILAKAGFLPPAAR